MLSERLRELLRARSFEPFVIQMNDGRRFEVPHPEFAALNPRGTEFLVYRKDGRSSLFLSTVLIASIEPKRRRVAR